MKSFVKVEGVKSLVITSIEGEVCELTQEEINRTMQRLLLGIALEDTLVIGAGVLALYGGYKIGKYISKQIRLKKQDIIE